MFTHTTKAQCTRYFTASTPRTFCINNCINRHKPSRPYKADKLQYSKLVLLPQMNALNSCCKFCRLTWLNNWSLKSWEHQGNAKLSCDWKLLSKLISGKIYKAFALSPNSTTLDNTCISMIPSLLLLSASTSQHGTNGGMQKTTGYSAY